MSCRGSFSQVPLISRRAVGRPFFGAGGGSRTHFSHPLLDAYYGLLRDVSAARRLSRSAFGGLANPGLVAPGNLDRDCWNCISLLRISGAVSGMSEYLVPYLACYLFCGFLGGDVPDQ